MKELIAGLEHKTKAIRYDCIKTLYEIAERHPRLISPHAAALTVLLDARDNRMQWGAMHALSALLPEIPGTLYEALGKLVDTADNGSVITRDHLVRILAGLSTQQQYQSATLPLLIAQVLQAPANQAPSYAEQALPVITPEFRENFIKALETRLQDIEQDSKRKRIEKVLKKLKA